MFYFLQKFTPLFCFIFLFPVPIWSGKILLLLMPESLSHRRTLYPMAETLQTRGHHVTLAAPGLTQPKLLSGKIQERFFIANTSDPELLEAFVYENATEWLNWLWEAEMNDALFLVTDCLFMNKICLEAIDQHKADMKKLMQRDWDLILVDDLFNACGVNMASLSAAPHASLSTTLIFSSNKYLKGIPYNPLITSPFFHKFELKPKQFWSRVQSVLSYCTEHIYAAASNIATIQSGKRLHSEHYQTLPEFFSNSEMYFTDYPNALEYPQPTRFDLVQAGSYCKSDHKPLPEHFERFVGDPKSKGTIYVAFGTHVRWSTAPTEKILVFKEAITRLKDYRIFWQYDGPKLELPNHVIVQEWFPQLDILAHNRTVAFLSHGGLKSLREGICEGVPMVVMPIFGDQMRNAFILKQKKVGTFLDKLMLMPDNIEFALRSVAEDSAMRRNMEKMRDFLQDQILDGPQMAVFWSEFLLRHQGVPRLFFSTRSQQLWLVQYFMLDVIGVFLGFFSLLICACYRAMYRVFFIRQV